jgi:hypothetical protein
MAGETDGAQTTTEAPETTAQPVVNAGETVSTETTAASGTTLLTTDPATAPESTTDETKTDEGKADGDTKGDDKGGDKAADETPIEYTDFSVPEGVQIDEQALGAFKPIAQELKLDQEQAQKLVSFYAEKQVADAKAWADQVSGWAEESRNDKEFGGAAFDGNLKVAVTGLEAFGTPELRGLLESTGIGNHPEMLRFCHRVGKALGEDKTLSPGAAAGRSVSAASVMFDHPTSKQLR